jgi:choline dehydrogenase
VSLRHFDYVIIGGGSAGCVLANRISADPTCSVLVLEAGRPDAWWDVLVHMPAAFALPLGNRFYDWGYRSQPEPHMAAREIAHARGKILGGSSSINGMIFQRGNPRDYDGWAQRPGLEHWSYAHCLPYFKRMESCSDGDASYRGREGPLVVERGRATGPLFDAFFQAAQQAGYPTNDDVNGSHQEGFGRFDRNVWGGRRWSAARAYLHPVAQRTNLAVQCRTFATRILFERRRAVGVEYLHRGQTERVHAGEVICAGGAINSPQLLQVSGVGPASLLRETGVEVVHDLPGVGENLQDHLEVYVQHGCAKPVSLAPNLRKRWRPWIGLQWLAGTGPGMTNHFEAGGFVRSSDDVDYPNLMIHFLPLAVRYDGTTATRGHGYQMHIGPMLSDARGAVRIRSADPRKAPGLRFNYLSTEQDRREWVEAIGCARRIFRQAAFREFDLGELSPGSEVVTEKEILDWVSREGETALHPSCSCRMGIDALSVVEPSSFRVHGTDGLRVVDASVMPAITNANIYAPVMMIAERAADAIVGHDALAPEFFTSASAGSDARFQSLCIRH